MITVIEASLQKIFFVGLLKIIIQNHSTMKRILIKDDDEDLFNVPLQPILYYYYKENLKEIRRMVKQQVRVNLWHIAFTSHTWENIIMYDN
jgi:hypothetical protein